MEEINYPLEQLATIKQRKLEEAEKVLSEKKKLLLKEQEKLQELEKERDKVKDHKIAKLTQLRETLDAGSTSDKIQQMKQYLKIVDEQLKQKEIKVSDQLKQVEAAEKQVEIARQDLFKKQQDVEKLKLHRTDWEKQMQVILEQKHNTESDELGAFRHDFKKRQKRSQNNHRKK